IIFNYPDVDAGDPTVDNGAGATVGIKAGGTQGPNRVLVSSNTLTPLVGSGKAIRITRSGDTWVGGGADNNWSTAANWASGIAPQPGDSLVFPSGSTGLTSNNDFLAGTNFQSITFTGSGYMLGGNALALSSGIDASLATGTNTINFNLTLNADQKIVAGTTGGNLSVAGNIDNGGFLLTVGGGTGAVTLGGTLSGVGGLTMNASGVLTPLGTNIYTGGTLVSAGTLAG